MIHHISLPASDPANVAKVIAELWQGYCAPFPSHADSYVALAGDKYGTVIEVYPLGTKMTPGQGDRPIQFQKEDAPSPYISSHAAISVKISEEKIKEIGKQQGWRVVRCSRGEFDIIEFWVENSVLLEIATPELAQKYLEILAPEKLAAHFQADR
ncbi:MAG: hypothetical protein QNJ38_04640 [Prochloraceae cyanobacterium]|nr:hypothetical protein [Prochloraceae cyanobacterium]